MRLMSNPIDTYLLALALFPMTANQEFKIQRLERLVIIFSQQ